MDILDCDCKFKFQCPKHWDALTEGDDPAIRFCATCRRSVYLCQSHDEVGRHAADGHCVAIGFSEETGYQGLVGDVVDWDDEPGRISKPRRHRIGYVVVGLAIVIAACAWMALRH